MVTVERETKRKMIMNVYKVTYQDHHGIKEVVKVGASGQEAVLDYVFESYDCAIIISCNEIDSSIPFTIEEASL